MPFWEHGKQQKQKLLSLPNKFLVFFVFKNRKQFLKTPTKQALRSSTARISGHWYEICTCFCPPISPYCVSRAVHGSWTKCSRRRPGFLMTRLLTNLQSGLCSLLQIVFDIWVRFIVNSRYVEAFTQLCLQSRCMTLFQICNNRDTYIALCIPTPFTRLVQSILCFFDFKILFWR